MKSCANRPLQFLFRLEEGPLGQKIGTLASDPEELGSIARNQYVPIYKGNIDDPEAHAASFISKFPDFPKYLNSKFNPLLTPSPCRFARKEHLLLVEWMVPSRSSLFFTFRVYLVGFLA